MLKQEDAQETRRRITAMLDDADAWIAKNASPKLLRSKWASYAVTVARPVSGKGIDMAARIRSMKTGVQ
jgi:hypothetical protein